MTGAIGFIGTGAITEAMVQGILQPPQLVEKVILSPRNEKISQRLAATFTAVEVAPSNQSVVNRAQIIVIAVRPQIAKEVVSSLRFRSGQQVLSLIAATPREVLLEWTGNDVVLTQAIPLPFVAQRQGVTAVYPGNTTIEQLFNGLGRAVSCREKSEYDLLAAASALMSTYFGMMHCAASWLRENGLAEDQSRDYLAPLFASLAQAAILNSSVTFDQMSREFATPGGLNEQVLQDFNRLGGADALYGALDGVLKRIKGQEGA